MIILKLVQDRYNVSQALIKGAYYKFLLNINPYHINLHQDLHGTAFENCVLSMDAASNAQ